MKKIFFPLWIVHYLWSKSCFIPNSIFEIPILIFQFVVIGIILPVVFLFTQIAWFSLPTKIKEGILHEIEKRFL